MRHGVPIKGVVLKSGLAARGGRPDTVNLDDRLLIARPREVPVRRRDQTKPPTGSSLPEPWSNFSPTPTKNVPLRTVTFSTASPPTSKRKRQVGSPDRADRSPLRPGGAFQSTRKARAHAVTVTLSPFADAH
jgi:hypothetical protein